MGHGLSPPCKLMDAAIIKIYGTIHFFQHLELDTDNNRQVVGSVCSHQ